MTKKTKRRAKRSSSQLARVVDTVQTAVNALQVDRSQIAIATGAFALGGLVTALARDEEVRAHSRALAVAVLDRMVGFVTDKQRARGEAYVEHH